MKTCLSSYMLLMLLAFAAGAADSTNSFFGVWQVDWGKAPVIERVPERYAVYFKTVDAYREYVARRAKGLVLDIRTNQTAVLRYADGKSESYRWGISPQAPKYDIWLQTWPHRLSFVSVGHGFKVSGTNTASLLFQLDWDEDVATRVPLVLERRQPNSDKPTR